MLNLIPLNTLGLALIWVICIGWLTLVLTVHHEKDKGRLRVIDNIDLSFRVVMILIIYSMAIYSFFGQCYVKADWLVWKLFLFGTTVAAGLGIRFHLKKFVPAFQRLMIEGPNDDINQAIKKKEHPPYNLWCTADDDYLFLKAGVDGYMQTYYELMSVED